METRIVVPYGLELWQYITNEKHQPKGRTMNTTNTRKFSALVDELGYKLLAIEFAYELNDKELEDTLNTIADNWNMEFTEDNTGLIHVSNDEDEEEDYTYSDEDEPSWNELMQDNYPSCEDGTIFDTPSGF